MPLFGTDITTDCIDCPSVDFKFTITDGVTSQIVENEETITFVDGLGINAVVSAVNTLTISLNANLGDLLNVSSATPSTGQILQWNGSTWIPSTFTSTFTCSDLNLCSIGNLWDVELTSTLFAGTALLYDTTAKAYVPAQPAFTVKVGTEQASIKVTDPLYLPSTLEFQVATGGGLKLTNDFTSSSTEVVRYGIDVSDAQAGDYLYFDGSSVIWTTVAPGGGGSFSCQSLTACVLESLSNVASGASDGQTLIYDATSGQWTPSTITGTFTNISLNGDSGTTQTLSSGDTLSILGGTGITTTASATDTITIDWSAALNDISDIDLAGLSSGDILQWDGVNWVPLTPSTITDTNIGLNDLVVGPMTSRDLTGTDATSSLTVSNFGLIRLLSIGNLTLDSSAGQIVCGDSIINDVQAIRFQDRSSPATGNKWNIGEGGNADPQVPYGNNLSAQDRLDFSHNGGTTNRFQLFGDGHVGINQAYYLPNNIVGASVNYVLTLVNTTSGETTWQASSGSGAVYLSDLLDADTTGVADGDLFTYDSGSGNWIPQTPSQYAVDTFSALTSGTTVTLNDNTVNLILVARNGQILYPGVDYTHTTGTTTVTFTPAFSGSENVIVHYFY